jgi:hypothetical protein
MQPIPIGNFNAVQEDGKWIYKAKEQEPLKKANPVYREKAQYPLQEFIEEQSMTRFRSTVKKTVLDTVQFIKNNL